MNDLTKKKLASQLLSFVAKSTDLAKDTLLDVTHQFENGFLSSFKSNEKCHDDGKIQIPYTKTILILYSVQSPLLPCHLCVPKFGSDSFPYVFGSQNIFSQYNVSEKKVNANGSDLVHGFYISLKKDIPLTFYVLFDSLPEYLKLLFFNSTWRVHCRVKRELPFANKKKLSFVWMDLQKAHLEQDLLIESTDHLHIKFLILPQLEPVPSLFITQKDLMHLHNKAVGLQKQAHNSEQGSFDFLNMETTPLQNSCMQSETIDAVKICNTEEHTPRETFSQDEVKSELDQWCFHMDGNYKDVRVLIRNLPQVLWKDCHWKPINTSELLVMEKDAFKRVYRKFLLLCHPDKHHSSSPEIQYRAHRIFQALNESYHVYQNKTSTRGTV